MRLTSGTKPRGTRIRTKRGNKVCMDFQCRVVAVVRVLEILNILESEYVHSCFLQIDYIEYIVWLGLC